MADYYPLIARAILGLEKNTGGARRVLYERARVALLAQLRSVGPRLTENDITRERLALEEAIRRAESDSARRTWVDPTEGVVLPRVRAPEFPRWDPPPGLMDPLSELSKLLDDGRLLDRDPKTFRSQQSELTDNAFPPHRADDSERAIGAWVNLSTRLKQEDHGAQVEVAAGGYLRFAASPATTDREAAVQPHVQQLQAELRRKARTLADRTLRLSNQAGWSGLSQAASLFAETVDRDVLDVADNISTLWSLSVSMGGFVEQDDEARANPSGLVDPLEADVLHQLRDLVATSGPWVRQFPTARNLDDASRDFMASLDDAQAAKRFLSYARDAAVVRKEDSAVVEVALDAGARTATMANKARGWATRSVRNIAVVMLFVVGGIAAGFNKEVGSSIAKESELARRIREVVLRAEKDLEQILSNLPADLRAALRTALEALRTSTSTTAK